MIKLKYIYPSLEINNNIAVVGSSSILKNLNQSKIIDSHQEVLRFNRAPVEKYSNLVGSKTTIRICNHHVFEGLDPGSRFTKEGQPKDFIKNTKNCNIIIGNGNSKKQWESRENKIDKTSKAYYIVSDFIQEIKTEFKFTKEPSVGFIGTLILVKNGIIPNLFGFGINEEVMTHYWEDRDPKVHHHNFNFERKILKELNDNGKIKIYYE